MHPWKPDVLDILCRIVRVGLHYVVPKTAAPLINGDGVPDQRYIRIVACIRKGLEVVKPAYRSYRVPYPNEVGFTLASHGPFEIGGHYITSFGVAVPPVTNCV